MLFFAGLSQFSKGNGTRRKSSTARIPQKSINGIRTSVRKEQTSCTVSGQYGQVGISLQQTWFYYRKAGEEPEATTESLG